MNAYARLDNPNAQFMSIKELTNVLLFGALIVVSA